MTDQPQAPAILGTATVFVVRDISAATAYYRDVQGFEVTFEYGEPVYYVCLQRDEAAIHLLAAAQSPQTPGNGALCLFVRDVDALYTELTARGARIPKPPQDYAYGMRDFDAFDADGNRLTFGMSTGTAP